MTFFLVSFHSIRTNVQYTCSTRAPSYLPRITFYLEQNLNFLFYFCIFFFHFISKHIKTQNVRVRLKNYNLETGLTASFLCGCNVSSLLFNCVLYSTLFSSTTYGLSSIVFPRIKSEANLISSFASSNKFNIYIKPHNNRK